MSATTEKPAWLMLTQHWLSLVGVALLATALISWLFVLPLQIRGHVANPYVGMVVFLIIPAVFFTGLILVPIGTYLSRRQIREGLAEVVDRKSAVRRLAWFFGITALLNVIIGTQITYRAVEHMETPQFCGASCHTMAPEFAAYQNSPHSRVECVECHVAPGAAGWVSSKTNGIRQLFGTVLKSSPRPIPSALESNRLVPASQTCENCHWPQKFNGVRLRLFSKYADDEANTRSETVLLMLVGGNRISGIHGAHLGPGVRIRFAAADPARKTIPWVEYRNTTTGDMRTFVSSEKQADSGQKALPEFDMECVDCHNRPTHAFDLPERAMDKALALGDIPVTLPYIKKKSVELLKTNYATSAEAAAKLPPALVTFYRQNYPDLYAARSQDIYLAGQAVLAIYDRNVFPDLKVTWGTYPNNLGHTDSPGCFRCHDGSHTTGDGKTITQDCNSCHEPLAVDEASPEILKTLGIADRLSKVQKQ